MMWTRQTKSSEDRQIGRWREGAEFEWLVWVVGERNERIVQRQD